MAEVLFRARLQREDASRPWGFRLQGGADYDRPLTLLKVVKDSIADKCKLHAGDILVRLGGQAAEGMTHKEAQEAIRQAGDGLEIIVERAEEVFLHYSSESSEEGDEGELGEPAGPENTQQNQASEHKDNNNKCSAVKMVDACSDNNVGVKQIQKQLEDLSRHSPLLCDERTSGGEESNSSLHSVNTEDVRLSDTSSIIPVHNSTPGSGLESENTGRTLDIEPGNEDVQDVGVIPESSSGNEMSRELDNPTLFVDNNSSESDSLSRQDKKTLDKSRELLKRIPMPSIEDHPQEDSRYRTSEYKPVNNINDDVPAVNLNIPSFTSDVDNFSSLGSSFESEGQPVSAATPVETPRSKVRQSTIEFISRENTTDVREEKLLTGTDTSLTSQTVSPHSGQFTNIPWRQSSTDKEESQSESQNIEKKLSEENVTFPTQSGETVEEVEVTHSKKIITEVTETKVDRKKERRESGDLYPWRRGRTLSQGEISKEEKSNSNVEQGVGTTTIHKVVKTTKTSLKEANPPVDREEALPVRQVAPPIEVLQAEPLKPSLKLVGKRIEIPATPTLPFPPYLQQEMHGSPLGSPHGCQSPVFSESPLFLLNTSGLASPMVQVDEHETGQNYKRVSLSQIPSQRTAFSPLVSSSVSYSQISTSKTPDGDASQTTSSQIEEHSEPTQEDLYFQATDPDLMDIPLPAVKEMVADLNRRLEAIAAQHPRLTKTSMATELGTAFTKKLSSEQDNDEQEIFIDTTPADIEALQHRLFGSEGIGNYQKLYDVTSPINSPPPQRKIMGFISEMHSPSGGKINRRVHFAEPVEQSVIEIEPSARARRRERRANREAAAAATAAELSQGLTSVSRIELVNPDQEGAAFQRVVTPTCESLPYISQQRTREGNLTVFNPPLVASSDRGNRDTLLMVPGLTTPGMLSPGSWSPDTLSADHLMAKPLEKSGSLSPSRTSPQPQAQAMKPSPLAALQPTKPQAPAPGLISVSIRKGDQSNPVTFTLPSGQPGQPTHFRYTISGRKNSEPFAYSNPPSYEESLRKRVQLGQQRSWDDSVMGTSLSNDLAFLRTASGPLSPPQRASPSLTTSNLEGLSFSPQMSPGVEYLIPPQQTPGRGPPSPVLDTTQSKSFKALEKQYTDGGRSRHVGASSQSGTVPVNVEVQAQHRQVLQPAAVGRPFLPESRSATPTPKTATTSAAGPALSPGGEAPAMTPYTLLTPAHVPPSQYVARSPSPQGYVSPPPPMHPGMPPGQAVLPPGGTMYGPPDMSRTLLDTPDMSRTLLDTPQIGIVNKIPGVFALFDKTFTEKFLQWQNQRRSHFQSETYKLVHEMDDKERQDHQ